MQTTTERMSFPAEYMRFDQKGENAGFKLTNLKPDSKIEPILYFIHSYNLLPSCLNTKKLKEFLESRAISDPGPLINMEARNKGRAEMP